MQRDQIIFYLKKALIILNRFYLWLNKTTVQFWDIVLKKLPETRFKKVLSTLLSSPATSLFINTVSFYSVSVTLAGGYGIIGFSFMTLAAINVVFFCLNLLNLIPNE